MHIYRNHKSLSNKFIVFVLNQIAIQPLSLTQMWRIVPQFLKLLVWYDEIYGKRTKLHPFSSDGQADWNWSSYHTVEWMRENQLFVVFWGLRWLDCHLLLQLLVAHLSQWYIHYQSISHCTIYFALSNPTKPFPPPPSVSLKWH